MDEIQRIPDLFPLLRVLADRPDLQVRFLVLGSASPQLMRQSSESLAGRISYYELSGFDLGEVHSAKADELWVRGAFPRSFLAADDAASDLWRQDFILTYLERDLPGLGINLPAGLLRRFWTMHISPIRVNARSSRRSYTCEIPGYYIRCSGFGISQS